MISGLLKITVVYVVLQTLSSDCRHTTLVRGSTNTVLLLNCMSTLIYTVLKTS